MSKRSLMLVLVLAAACIVDMATAGPAKRAHLIAKIEEFDRTVRYEVMTPRELAKQQKMANLEAKLLPQAYAAAKKEWREKKEGADKTFPISKPRPRKVVKQASATTAEKAEARAEKYEEKVTKERNRLNEKKADQLEGMSDSRRERYIRREDLEEEALDLIIEKLDALVEAVLAKSAGKR